ncbi:diacylglycerol kinase [Vibrio splendidus]|uniref:diacylglycerol kinase n=1 Tax=Vibrio splendidus TaxID=29497 RepID=UPI000067020E|nr:diacylglycerol kinase [Vibrio splendidus]EAP94603.1 diacylglycerol kinase [Vibrio splendidus 12B01]PMP42218.1 diacylglycerol kinase [Vibrio splendidus]
MKPGETGVKRVIHATRYSISGISSAWVHEAAFRQEVVLMVILSCLAVMLPVENYERTLLISSLFLVVIVELLNSSIEVVVDRVGEEWNELSGRAKDIASAAVFISIINVVYVWSSIIIHIL